MSEYKKQEASLRALFAEVKLEGAFKVAIENIKDFFIVLDDAGAIIYANRAILSALGYSLVELKYKPFMNLLADRDVERTLEAFERSKNTGKIGSFQNSYLKKDGSELKIHWRDSFSVDGITFGIAELA